MHDHPDIDDDALLHRFATNTLPGFPHEEHLHVVFVKAARAPLAETLEFVRTGIIAMAGDSGKYHDTRTTAWVQIIVAARAGFTGTFAEFLVAHPELLRRDVLSDYYSDALLTSREARARFVAPDLRELPAASGI
ncbi:MAG TPA: hypothetical protein VL294_03775 [Pseudolysinimonas sp.]|jgi:hypothetical protein|nr:hypothetical protein [Pseudolysinimonas sp.]